jgi:hypothetical protein
MILPAALKKHSHDSSLLKHIQNVDGRVCLGEYLVRVVNFVRDNGLTFCAANKFRDSLNEPDALDIIRFDALPVMENYRGLLELTREEVRQLDAVLKAVKWYQHQGYRNVLRPANDLHPMPTLVH